MPNIAYIKLKMVEVFVETLQPANIEDIQDFLQEFKAQKAEYGIIFYDRKKNLQGLLDLEISAQYREKMIDSLTVVDYYKGPKPDGVKPGADYWEFGSRVKGRQVYIKISCGLGDGPVACFSFHAAERKIKYPYK